MTARFIPIAIVVCRSLFLGQVFLTAMKQYHFSSKDNILKNVGDLFVKLGLL